MLVFSKESLESLRQRIDLVEVLSAHMELKRSGVSYKALCPFHDEKTPSFMVQKGDSHYHCFGCGAHGDAIQFLMTFLKLSFAEAVENLAQKFHVHLEQMENHNENKGPDKKRLKEILNDASELFHYLLLHTEEGRGPLKYLFSRGIDLCFIRCFQLGLASKNPEILRKYMRAKYIPAESLAEVGLVTPSKSGGWRDFFSDRILIPIRDSVGAVIGFSGRKYKEETYGGKYINTPETPLFKKSRVLFGLSYCRRRIAKERRALVVEGQIDALRLIQAGLNFTVAGQGTAFGEGHVSELLNLGVNQVFLALDSDDAGMQASYKIGDMFQKAGVEVKIVPLPEKTDPDEFLREKGGQEFMGLMDKSADYLSFALDYAAKKIDMASPAGKNELILNLTKQIRNWDHPLMVHESLRKLAELTKTPESMIGVGQEYTPNLYIKKSGSVGIQSVDPDRILESDFLRWILLMGESHPRLMEIAKKNLNSESFRVKNCQKIYQICLSNFQEKRPCNLLNMAIELEDSDAQILLSEILQKKVNKDRVEVQFIDSIQKILDRNWMEAREKIKIQIQSGQCSEEQVSDLVKRFDEIKRAPPVVLGVS